MPRTQLNDNGEWLVTGLDVIARKYLGGGWIFMGTREVGVLLAGSIVIELTVSMDNAMFSFGWKERDEGEIEGAENRSKGLGGERQKTFVN